MGGLGTANNGRVCTLHAQLTTTNSALLFSVVTTALFNKTLLKDMAFPIQRQIKRATCKRYYIKLYIDMRA